jgi:hypothetical protein
LSHRLLAPHTAPPIQFLASWAIQAAINTAAPGYFSDNLSLFKSIPTPHESALELRFDAFNLTNTPAFGLPNASLGSNLGKISSTLGSGVGNVNGVGGPRVLQAAAKFTF